MIASTSRPTRTARGSAAALGHRFDIDRGEVTVRYDASVDAVEQTFLLVDGEDGVLAGGTWAFQATYRDPASILPTLRYQTNGAYGTFE